MKVSHSNPRSSDHHRPLLTRFLFNAYTVWLFPYEQIYDVVLPSTVFALSTALSGPHLDLPQQSRSSIFTRAPLVLLWLWLLTLQFCIQNQRHLSSAQEDAKNKPWRPIPARRITPVAAADALTVVYLVTGLASHCLGVFPYYIAFSSLAAYHNDFGGGDSNGVVRNMLNAGGFTCFFAGALEIAIDGLKEKNEAAAARLWVGLLALVMLTTIHAQDFRDEEGDRLKGRSTVTTMMGELGSRWSVAGAVLFWSLYLPRWIGIQASGNIGVVGLGCCVAGMTLIGMGRQDAWLDGVMYRVYNVWLMGMCLLPLGLLLS